MRKILIFFILLLSIVFASCRHQRCKDNKLEAIDSLLGQGHVDTAYTEICDIQVADLQSGDDSAYFFLLRAQAEYRLYKPISSMKSLDFSIQHYLNTPSEKEKLASAYFYKAGFLYESHDTKNTLEYIKNAEFIAEKTNNTVLKHKIYEGLLVINEEAGEDKTALEYSKKSINVSLKAKRNDWLAHAYNNIAVVYAKMEQKDSSDVYLKKSMALLKSIPKKDRLFIINNIGVYFMQTQPETAKHYFQQAINIAPNDEVYKNLASIYALEGNATVADSLWKKTLNTDNLQIKDEVMHTMFKFQMSRGDFKNASATASKLIELKDSLSEKRNDSNVKAIQAEFDKMKSQQEYERNIALAIACITLLFLIVIITLLYFRYKQYKIKAVMAHDQMMIKNYESQISELERMDQHKEKEIESINKRKEKLLEKHRNTLNRGYTLFSDIQNDKGTIVLWKKSDFENVIEYYRLVDVEFVDKLDNSYDELSPKYKFFLILEHIGKTDAEIMNIMAVAEVSLRSIRSRINKKRK